MNEEETLQSLKRDILQHLPEVKDAAKLQRMLELLSGNAPTPQVLLDRIDRGRAESKAGLGRPVEELLEEMEDW